MDKAPVKIGVGGPVGSGKTALVDRLCKRMRDRYAIAVVTNDIYTKEDAEFLTRSGALSPERISGVETGGCPHTAIREDISLNREAMEILEIMSMADKADVRTGGLTQIELRKLELARAMAAKPRLLISDEAMAGLSNTEVDDILEILVRLNEEGLTVIMIEHIMRAVMNFSERIVVLDAGEKIAEGTPDEIVNNKDVERAYLGA